MEGSLAIARNGLQGGTGPRKTVLILGAGIAGLVAAYELCKAGHAVTVLEARTRPGGRIFTLREPFAPDLYAEAGAMRIPSSHALMRHYVEQFSLGTAPFTVSNPDVLPYPYPERKEGKTINTLWEEMVAPWVERIRENREEGWAALDASFGNLSLRQILEHHGWSEEAIEVYSMVDSP